MGIVEDFHRLMHPELYEEEEAKLADKQFADIVKKIQESLEAVVLHENNQIFSQFSSMD